MQGVTHIDPRAAISFSPPIIDELSISISKVQFTPVMWLLELTRFRMLHCDQSFSICKPLKCLMILPKAPVELACMFSRTFNF